MREETDGFEQKDCAESVMAASAKAHSQSTLLAGLDPVDHDRPDVKRLDERAKAQTSVGKAKDDAET